MRDILLNPHANLSSYLVKPDLSRRRQRQWAGFYTRILQIRRVHPYLVSRTLGALAIWSVVAASFNYITTPHNLPAHKAATSDSSTIAQPTAQSNSATLAKASRAPALPSGPSGQLLPPGTLAPHGTYSNSYAYGQCTWYVAGRRQIPPNWGNARSWYYHATANGWSVGAIPAVAAIAWTPSGYYGHVALVEQVSADGKEIYLSEMNYRGIGIKGYRWEPASAFKYIY